MELSQGITRWHKMTMPYSAGAAALEQATAPPSDVNPTAPNPSLLSNASGAVKSAGSKVAKTAGNVWTIIVGVPILLILAGTKLGPFIVLTLGAVLLYQFVKPITKVTPS